MKSPTMNTLQETLNPVTEPETRLNGLKRMEQVSGEIRSQGFPGSDQADAPGESSRDAGPQLERTGKPSSISNETSGRDNPDIKENDEDIHDTDVNGQDPGSTALGRIKNNAPKAGEGNDEDEDEDEDEEDDDDDDEEEKDEDDEGEEADTEEEDPVLTEEDLDELDVSEDEADEIEWDDENEQTDEQEEDASR